MSYFPRGEIASNELLSFELSSERGIYSDGTLTAAGLSAVDLTGAPVASASTAIVGASAVATVGASLNQALVQSASQSVLTLIADAIREVQLASEGRAQAAFEGVTFKPALAVDSDALVRESESRGMGRPGEYRNMFLAPAGAATREAEQREVAR